MVDIFPQELLDAIICRLAGDRKSLSSCSLVSRAFSASSRPYIFNRVELSMSDYRPAERLLSILDQSPQALVRCIRVLVLKITAIPSDHRDLHHFVQLIKRLPSLRRLIWISQDGKNLPWKPLSLITTPIVSLLQSPSISHIELDGIDDFPLTLLASLVGLQGLKLSSIRPYYSPGSIADSDGLDSPPARRIVLYSLWLYLAPGPLSTVVGFLLDSRYPLDISQLRKLTIDADGRAGAHDDVWRLVDTCATSLEDFEFKPAISCKPHLYSIVIDAETRIYPASFSTSCP